jgi:HEPN domain-containing protein
MDNNYDPLSGIEWLKRAKSNLNRGKESQDLEAREIFIEDLCFDLQQCAEKALKALTSRIIFLHHLKREKCGDNFA